MLYLTQLPHLITQHIPRHTLAQIAADLGYNFTDYPGPYLAQVGYLLRQAQLNDNGRSLRAALHQHNPRLFPLDAVKALPAANLDLRQLIDIITTTHDIDELNTLIFNLDINPDEIAPGRPLTARAQALVRYCDRNGRIPDLRQQIQETRPRVLSSG
jgi:hypothetical protein